jgi:hypothetical protein
VAKGTNIQILENGVFTLGDVTFLGATLWTDFALNGDPVVSEVVAQTGMNDYRRIRTLPRYRRLKPSETRGFHLESRRWLEEQVFSRPDEKIVIVTHHAPSPQSIPPNFQESTFNPSFASDMTRFITESKAKLWIHGHIHSHSDCALVGLTFLQSYGYVNSRGVEHPACWSPGDFCNVLDDIHHALARLTSINEKLNWLRYGERAAKSELSRSASLPDSNPPAA